MFYNNCDFNYFQDNILTVNFQQLPPNVPLMPMQPVIIPYQVAGFHQQPHVYPPQLPIQGYPLYNHQFIHGHAPWLQLPQWNKPHIPPPQRNMHYIPPPPCYIPYNQPQADMAFHPPFRYQQGTSVYVRGIALSVTKAQLIDEFKCFGELIIHFTKVTVILFIPNTRKL